MSGLEAAQLANLVLVGIVAGNDVGTWVVVHPALNAIPLAADVPAHRSIIRRYGYFMPWFGPLTLASAIVVVFMIDDRSSAAFGFAVAGTAAFFVWQVINLAVGRLSLQLRDVPDDISSDDWWALRRRWDLGHMVGTLLATGALACFAVAAVLA